MSERGFTIKKQSQTITAGDLELNVTFDDHDRPDDIMINVFDERISLGVEQLERVAKVMQSIRSIAGDYREVCPTHGYFKRADFSSTCDRCSASHDEARAS